MSEITHLRSIGITAPDLPGLVRFYEQTWGLRRVGQDGAGTVYLRASGPEHHVVALSPGSGRALRLISLGAASPADVDLLAARLRRLGVGLTAGPAPRDLPGGGYAVRFADPEGRAIEVSAGLAEHEPAGDDGPQRLSHIVLNAPALPLSKAFYTDVLGFRVSDWYENDLMVFLRCNSQHHCVVLTPNDWPTINHVAFEVGDVDAVMRALGRMRAAGYDSIWGPGRHGPGGNVFCYFTDPAGNVIEYTAELIDVDENSWEARSWERSARNADVWGTSGGITPAVAAAMRNPPEPS